MRSDIKMKEITQNESENENLPNCLFDLICVYVFFLFQIFHSLLFLLIFLFSFDSLSTVFYRNFHIGFEYEMREEH